MTSFTTKPLSWFKRKPQVRREFDEVELRQLGESMKAHGQLQPVLAQADGTLIAGERRLRAAELVGLPTLNVMLVDEPQGEAQTKIIQLVENLHRSDLRDGEKWQAFDELLRLNPGWSNKDLAAHLKLSESTITKYQAASRCISEVQKALLSGQLGVTAVYEISRAPADQQAELLRLKLSGTSRDGLAERVRKQKRSATQQVRVKRISCPLPSGVGIVVTGGELSLDDLIEALAETLKEAKKAREQSLDVKTFSLLLKDKASSAK